jgi:hypothetical protein
MEIFMAGCIFDEGVFQRKMLAVMSAYASAWRIIKGEVKKIDNPRGFFILDYVCTRLKPGDNRNGETLNMTLFGTMQYSEATDSLVTNISEFNDVTGVERILFNEAYMYEY